MMSINEQIRQVDIDSLKIVYYPDPRLRQISAPLEVVDEAVRRLAEKMLQLMFASRGVGLAAPQVGIAGRLFVASPTSDPADRQVYVNPQIVSVEGSQEGEEGCLSFPSINCKIKRPNVAIIRALNLNGEVFEQFGQGLAARIYLHEIDHLDGKLLVDRMGSVAKLANRKLLRELEDDFAKSIA